MKTPREADYSHTKLEWREPKDWSNHKPMIVDQVATVPKKRGFKERLGDLMIDFGYWLLK